LHIFSTSVFEECENFKFKWQLHFLLILYWNKTTISRNTQIVTWIMSVVFCTVCATENLGWSFTNEIRIYYLPIKLLQWLTISLRLKARLHHDIPGPEQSNILWNTADRLQLQRFSLAVFWLASSSSSHDDTIFSSFYFFFHCIVFLPHVLPAISLLSASYCNFYSSVRNKCIFGSQFYSYALE
jgi:hypothetical protein